MFNYLLSSTGPDLRSSLQDRLIGAGVDPSETGTMAANMATYVLKSRADSTTQKYTGCFEKFSTFCASKNLRAKPASSIIVSLYISQLLDQGKSFSVISSAIYAIKWVHSIHGLEDPTDDSVVKHLSDAAKRLTSKPKTRMDVIDTSILISLCEMFSNDLTLINVRDLTMILLCYAGFLRFNDMSNLRCSDIRFENDHIVVKIRSSKTDIYREGREVLIAKGSTIACPYTMLQRYMELAGLSTSSEEFLIRPMFQSKGVHSLINKNKKISYTRARECIVNKLSLVAPGLKLGTHTLRASGATSAANVAGLSDRCIKRHGRWKTDQAKDGYICDSLEKKLMITRCLGL